MTAPYRRIGIIREGKNPPDRRTPLTPAQCRAALDRHQGLDITVQRSPGRAFTDAEYEAAGIPLVDDLSDRDLIIGIKEIPVDMLLPGRSHLIFSHTIKEQPHNRKLLKAVLERNIELIDHELLTNEDGERVLAFGYWAGVVGTYNAFRAWRLVDGGSALKPAHQCRDLDEVEEQLRTFSPPRGLRVVITGGGRVGKGAIGMLERAGLRRTGPEDFLEKEHSGPVYTMLSSPDLYEREDGKPFSRETFHSDPRGHRSRLLPYARRAHIYLACHFWDPRGPKILSAADLRDPALSLRVVADISCDVNGPIDSTLRASAITDPFYGYDPATGEERPTGTPGTITVMAVDNLPCELPRDASETFGQVLLDRVLPELLGNDPSGMIERAVIARNGRLTERFAHLADYASG